MAGACDTCSFANAGFVAEVIETVTVETAVGDSLSLGFNTGQVVFVVITESFSGYGGTGETV